MNVEEFLRRVLPVAGPHYYSAVVSNNKFSQQRLRSIDQLVSFSHRCARKKCDVYFATGSFGEQRTSHDCNNKKALYLDIDCGLGKPYADKTTAVHALIKFSDKHFIRPNIIVDSGNGIHAYWTFTKEIAAKDWQPLAGALKELCTLNGLEADPTVTADAARILRIPDTFNQKGDTPHKVRVIHDTSNEYDPDDLKKILGHKKSVSLTALASLADENDLEFFASVGTTPFFGAKIIDSCGVLKHTYETGGADQQEPLWMAQLSLMAYAVDGAEYIHALSDGHKDYDYQRTERKYAQRLATKESGKFGPPLCKTLGLYLPETCKKCPHFERIKSPIVLGREEDGTDLPFPYKQDDKNIYLAQEVESDDGELTTQMVKMLSFPIDNFQLYASSDPTVGMVYRFIVNKYGVKAAEFTTQQLVDKRQITVALSNSNISLQPSEYMGFHKLMTSWAAKMVQAKQVGQPTTALGWTEYEGKPAFTLIDKLITTDHGDKEVAFLDKEFVKDFTPKGTKETWLSVARFLTSEDRHSITAGILSAFASPLIKFTGVNGCVLALVSDKSGTGKSTALRVAQSVWGDPRRGVNALDDTPLSVANRMGKLKNLPAFWDELRMRDQVEKFIILMFQVSQGKERSRLTSQVQTRHVGTWNTLITVASNESITDHVRHLVHGTDAGLLRVFEVTVPYLTRTRDIDAECAALDNNFGNIGGEYAAWLVKNHAQVLILLEKVKLGFSKKVRADSAERFWVATCTSLLTAAIIANKLGFTAINMNEFTAWLAKEFIRSRAEQTMDFDPVDIRAKKFLMQYLDVVRDQIVVFDHLSCKGKKGVGSLHSVIPRDEILGVYAIKDNMVRIKKVNFSNWIYTEHREPPSKIIQALLEMGCLERKASVAVGVENVVQTRTLVLDMPLGSTVFDGFIEGAPDPTSVDASVFETEA